MVPKIKTKHAGGRSFVEATCPGCNRTSEIDADMYRGRVSMDCSNCEYHETHDLSKVGIVVEEDILFEEPAW